MTAGSPPSLEFYHAARLALWLGFPELSDQRRASLSWGPTRMGVAGMWGEVGWELRWAYPGFFRRERLPVFLRASLIRAGLGPHFWSLPDSEGDSALRPSLMHLIEDPWPLRDRRCWQENGRGRASVSGSGGDKGFCPRTASSPTPARLRLRLGGRFSCLPRGDWDPPDPRKAGEAGCLATARLVGWEPDPRNRVGGLRCQEPLPGWSRPSKG